MTDVIQFRQADANKRVLLLSKDPQLAREVAALIENPEYRLETVSDADTAACRLSEEPIDACLVAVDDQGQSVCELSAGANDWFQPTMLLAVVPADSVGSIRVPADCEVIPWPCPAERLAHRARSAAAYGALLAENRGLRRQMRQRLHEELAGHSPAMELLREIVTTAAQGDAPVLVQGEPGSGVLAAARAIHLRSDRAHRRLVTLDCRLLSSACISRELFGDRRAKRPLTGNSVAFPGVAQGPVSRLSQAAGGTLILDNIDAVALPLQKQLLDDLARRPASVGSGRLAPRFVFTSHVDLTQRTAQSRFRSDLYELLSCCVVAVPPLRKRRQDIALLTEQFLHRLACQEGQPPRRIEPDAIALLCQHDWPGNVRELWNVIHRACALDNSGWLTADMLRPWLAADLAHQNSMTPGLTLRDMERKLIETTFNRCGGNRERTAQSLQIGLRTLSGKLREYGYPPRGGPGSNSPQYRPKAA